MNAGWYARLLRHPMLLPAIERTRKGGAQIMTVLDQYRATERLPPADLDLQQRTLLHSLAEHAAAQSPHFGRRLANGHLTPARLAAPGGLARLAPLTRRELVDAKESLFCRAVPPAQGKVSPTTTSGSTGEPVTVRRTQLCQLHWFAQTLREHLWHDRDFSQRLAVLRAHIPDASRHPDWGSPCADVLRTGPALIVPVSQAAEQILDQLVDFQPGYLLVLPGVLGSLLDLMDKTDRSFDRLRGVRTVGETVSADLREKVRRKFKLEIDDAYSSQECGIMATQCPEQGRYHVSETVILEIVDERGAPCAPGETGRILVTDLSNYATPLIRYEIGDYAQAGFPCSCGLGLPVVHRFLGRERNLVLLPDGSRHWPIFGFNQWGEIYPIRQYQFRQLDRHTIEARLSAEGRPSEAQETRLTAIIRQSLGYPFEIRYIWQDAPIERGAGGKFEEFLCLAR